MELNDYLLKIVFKKKKKQQSEVKLKFESKAISNSLNHIYLQTMIATNHIFIIMFKTTVWKEKIAINNFKFKLKNISTTLLMTQIKFTIL